MPLDPHAKRFLDKLAAAAPRGPGALSIGQRRASLEQLLGFGGEPEAVARLEKRSIPGPAGTLRIWVYTPAGAPMGLLPGLVYFHGGGLVAGSLETHDGICRSLTNASGCRLISVGYRLGPEAPFPAAVLDACAATRWVADHAGRLGIDAHALGVSGDSAGGTIAAGVAQILSAESGPRLALQCLLCPILDYQAATPSREAFGFGYLLDRETLQDDLRHYMGDSVAADDPRICPSRAQRLEGLPPACIHTAECDPLRDEGAAYAERLEQAGVRVSYRCHPGMIHLFYGLKTVIPYAATAYRLLGADIRALFESRERP